jgi:hypothetical protein
VAAVTKIVTMLKKGSPQLWTEQKH